MELCLWPFLSADTRWRWAVCSAPHTFSLDTVPTDWTAGLLNTVFRFVCDKRLEATPLLSQISTWPLPSMSLPNHASLHILSLDTCMFWTTDSVLIYVIYKQRKCTLKVPVCMWLYTGCTKNTFSIGKTFPLQAWTSPEGSRRLRHPDFKTVGTWRW